MKQKEMSQLTIVIDKSLREQAKLVFKASGLSLQEAITYFFEQCTERNTLPFAVCRDPQTRGSKAPELAVRVFDIDTKTWRSHLRCATSPSGLIRNCANMPRRFSPIGA